MEEGHIRFAELSSGFVELSDQTTTIPTELLPQHYDRIPPVNGMAKRGRSAKVVDAGDCIATAVAKPHNKKYVS